ncbi:MAG: response regulator transcription factor [Thermomicrobiales bacterium]|nr:response regulator transcription factor [Thermomicrobiales bacterium]
MRKHLILVADDDAPILRLVRAKLQTDGYAVVTATNGAEAVEIAERERPDLVILDIMMPVMDGLEAMKHIRQVSTVPIILLTARASGSDKIRGLDQGADDYVTKPFDPDELSARVAAIMRRISGTGSSSLQILTYPNVTIDLTNRSVTVNDEEMQLSRTEWEVLYQLASNAGRVMLHSELLARIWGPEFRDETYYLRTWVSRIRKKLGDQDNDAPIIRTFPGVGYRMELPNEDS